MKCLTIKEPWATLIINGYKTYEFRSWRTHYRGKILIHAGQGIEKSMVNNIADYNLEYSSGSIIGEAILEDCILVSPDFDKKLRDENPVVYGNNHVNDYVWKLTSIKKYKKPIQIKGKLGLWNYDIDNN